MQKTYSLQSFQNKLKKIFNVKVFVNDNANCVVITLVSIVVILLFYFFIICNL